LVLRIAISNEIIPAKVVIENLAARQILGKQNWPFKLVCSKRAARAS